MLDVFNGPNGMLDLHNMEGFEMQLKIVHLCPGLILLAKISWQIVSAILAKKI